VLAELGHGGQAAVHLIFDAAVTFGRKVTG